MTVGTALPRGHALRRLWFAWRFRGCRFECVACGFELPYREALVHDCRLTRGAKRRVQRAIRKRRAVRLRGGRRREVRNG